MTRYRTDKMSTYDLTWDYLARNHKTFL